MSAAKCETGWGEGLSTRALLKARDRHPTPARLVLRTMRSDPPPPGEGKKVHSSQSQLLQLAAQLVQLIGLAQDRKLRADL